MKPIPPLDSRYLEALITSMVCARDVMGVAVPLEPEQVFSSEILAQLRSCGFLRTLQ